MMYLKRDTIKDAQRKRQIKVTLSLGSGSPFVCLCGSWFQAFRP